VRILGSGRHTVSIFQPASLTPWRTAARCAVSENTASGHGRNTEDDVDGGEPVRRDVSAHIFTGLRTATRESPKRRGDIDRMSESRHRIPRR
jgi:hypothetical protein